MTTNTLSHSDLVSNKILANFSMQMSFLATGDNQLDQDFKQTYYKPGDTVNIRKVNKFNVQRGNTITAQDITESTEPVTVQPFYSVAMDFNLFDETLIVDDVERRYIKPAIQEIISDIEQDIAIAGTTQCYQYAGTPGSPLNSFSAVDLAATFLVERDIPADELYFATRPRDASALKSSLQNNFNDTLNQEISFGSRLGHLSEFDMFRNRGIAYHTAGTAAGQSTIQTVGTTSSGSTLSLDGLSPATSTFKAGDLITVGGVYSLTNLGRTSTLQNMQFMVTADATASGGAVTISISPAIISDPTDPNRNVSNAIANDSPVTVAASGWNNMAYHRTGLTCVTLTPKPLNTVYCKNMTDPDTGCVIQIASNGDILNNANITRLNVLVGYKWHPQYAMRYLT
jgi:hypothetical protein